DAFFPDFEVQMGSRTPAGAPHRSNELSPHDSITQRNAESRIVSVSSLQPEPVVEDHQVPVLRIPSGERDGSSRGSSNWRPSRCSNVDAGMKAGGVGTLRQELARHGPAQRPAARHRSSEVFLALANVVRLER